MAKPLFDVVGIGNAIVDVLARADDGFLKTHELAKGAMTLIDAERAEHLYSVMESRMECSGGSAANTITCLASLGGRGAYVGKVRDDALGKSFRQDIRGLGIGFDTEPSTVGAPTARCLIFVTPDAQRTMNTYLGACIQLGPDDIDEAVIGNAAVTYMEGYLWDPPGAKQAFLKAAGMAHAANRLVSLSLSDSFCVDRHRESFLDLVANHVDVLFANEDEILSLYQTQSLEAAIERARQDCRISAITCGPKGSLVIAGADTHVIEVSPVQAVDTTGAGDSYAAGFLFGLTRGYDLADCGRLGGIAAAEIISHVGARPEVPLATLISHIAK
jgi:sugar/nucleoside kinase (ribokinase family)